MYRILCDPKVMQFSMGVLKPADVEIWVKNRIEEYAGQEFGIWGVVDKETNGLIGYCGLSRLLDEGQSDIQIGLRLVQSCWSQDF